jgi:hypothetical protein
VARRPNNDARSRAAGDLSPLAKVRSGRAACVVHEPHRHEPAHPLHDYGGGHGRGEQETR